MVHTQGARDDLTDASAGSGADKTRMKNASDVERQNETTRVLLDRLYRTI